MRDPYQARVGATFRGIINDLKRDTATAAAELGVPVELLAKVIDGQTALPAEVVGRAVASWPVNERDFFPLHDDAPDGLVVMTADESARTSRVFDRGGVAYYEYRDTAMSRLAMFRPEWIRMLQQVDDDEPDNPAVRWNNGHLLYQFTYFVGDVNYYYEWGARRFCARMTTGDSVSGLPYAPHSFACRAGRSGRILALTYGGRLLGDAQHEIGALGAELAERYAPDNANVLGELLADTMVTPARLSEATGIAIGRVMRLLSGTEVPTADELEAIAEALHVNVRDLLPLSGDEVDGVHIVRGDTAASWPVRGGQYRVKALAGTRLCPSSRALEIEVLGTTPAVLETGLHQYCYVLGPDPVRLVWHNRGEQHERLVEPGDSIYLKPFVPHGFAVSGGGGSKVLALRIAGRLGGDTRMEAAALGGSTLRRLVLDNRQWFDSRQTGAK